MNEFIRFLDLIRLTDYICYVYDSEIIGGAEGIEPKKEAKAQSEAAEAQAEEKEKKVNKDLVEKKKN